MADENLVLLRLVQDAILSIVRQLDGDNVSEDMKDYLAFRLDQLYGHILRLTASNPVEPLIFEAARCLRILVGMSSSDYYKLPLETQWACWTAAIWSIESTPRIIAAKRLYWQTDFMLSVSLSTVRRRMRDFNLSVRDLYSSFSEEQLDNVLQSILWDFPDCGYRRALGELKSREVSRFW